jgi:hypothetical protein
MIKQRENEQRERLVSTRFHRDALLSSEVRCLERTLRSYGVLTDGHLAELSGATHWGRGRLRQALRQGLREGVLRRPGRGFVEIPPERR